MTAKEAYEKTLWNKLPEELRREVEDCIKRGRFSAYFYESISPILFDDSYYGILAELDYSIEIFKIQHKENNLIDNKLIISWRE